MMRRLALFGVLAASLLGGCACLHRGYGNDPAAPQVFIAFKDGGSLKPVIAVSPDPLFFRKDQINVRIVWRLPQNLGLKFAADGIVIEGEVTSKPPGDANTKQGNLAPLIFLERKQDEIVDCRPSGDGLEFSCLYRHTRPGLFKYTIRVLSGPTSLEPLDPTVMGN